MKSLNRNWKLDVSRVRSCSGAPATSTLYARRRGCLAKQRTGSCKIVRHAPHHEAAHALSANARVDMAREDSNKWPYKYRKNLCMLDVSTANDRKPLCVFSDAHGHANCSDAGASYVHALWGLQMLAAFSRDQSERRMSVVILFGFSAFWL